MSTRMSFFWNLAAERRLGGRQWNLFLDCETLRKMTADRCITLGGHWGLEDGIGGWCSSTTCHLSPSQKTAEWCPGGVWRDVGLKKRRNFVLHFHSPTSVILFLLFFFRDSCLFDKGFHGGRVKFPWEWLICPLLQKGEAVPSFLCLALLQPGSHMMWPTFNLDSWNPKTSTLFFLCVLCSFSLLWSCYWVEELYQTCLPAGEKKALQSWLQLVDSFHLEIQVLHISLPVCFHSFSSSLVRSETHQVVFFFELKHFLFHSNHIHTYTRHSHQLAALDCGRRGLCDWGRPAGHALNTPTVLQQRGAGKREAWENTEASKQQRVTWPAAHTLHYCPDTITIHKGGKVPVTDLHTPK